jgi:hypothetical protein
MELEWSTRAAVANATPLSSDLPSGRYTLYVMSLDQMQIDLRMLTSMFVLCTMASRTVNMYTLHRL